MSSSAEHSGHDDSFGRTERIIIFLAIGFASMGGIVFVCAVIWFWRNQVGGAGPIHTGDFSNLGSFISGCVGSIWSFTGILLFYVTLRLQRVELSLQRQELVLTRKELKRSAKANSSMAEDNRAKAILDLYQAYTTEEFRKRQHRAWNIIKMCIGNKDYCDYVVMHFFLVTPSSSRNRILSGELLSYYKAEMKRRFPLLEIDSDAKALEEDRVDRAALGDLLNFFNLLAIRKSSREIEVFRSCEFYYDHWRPFLWFICDQRDRYYQQNEAAQHYARQVDWRKMLKAIDEFYEYEPLPERDDILKYIKGHPIIGDINSDHRHDFLKIR